MSIISALEYPDFETWVIETYPQLFEEWELEASEYLDLDEWLEREHFGVIVIWDKVKGRKVGDHTNRHSVQPIAEADAKSARSA